MQNGSNVLSELAPTGRLRVGVNFGNAVLATRNAAGYPGGIAVDLAGELARRVSLPLDLVTYEAAGKMAAQAGVWDVAFLAADPDRGEQIAFTKPYLEIESTYLVQDFSPLQSVDDVDRPGLRVAISEKSAYDLFLTRNLKHARLVRAPGPGPSVELFFEQRLDALAGIRPMLLEVARTRPAMRVLPDRFAVVRQALGVPRGRERAVPYLEGFVDDVRSSGFLARTIEKNGILGVSLV